MLLLLLVMVPPIILSAIYILSWMTSGHLGEKHKNIVRGAFYFLVNPKEWVESYLPSFETIPELHLDIKFKNLQKLSQKRAEALQLGKLIISPGDMVPAKLRYKDKTLTVRLRLKGDSLEHLQDNKWSFRIKVRREETLFGMRKFSLQHPITRAYEAEILFLHALKREDLLVPRYFFVKVFVNGKNIGIMGLEEHMAKELLESQNRKEGPILKFDDNRYWQYPFAPFRKAFKDIRLLPISIIGANPAKKNETFREYLKTGTGLLRSFFEGIHPVPASQVFDPILTGRYLAVARIWGALHSLEYDDARFYYNPISAKFELIGRNGRVCLADGINPVNCGDSYLFWYLLEDQQINSVYSKTLQRLNKEFQDGTTLKWAKKLQEENLKILRREFHGIAGLNLNKLKEKASESARLNRQLLDLSRGFPDFLRIYHLKDLEGRAILEIANVLQNPVTVTSIVAIDRLTGKTRDLLSHSSQTFPFTLKGNTIGSNPVFKRIGLNETIDLQKYSIQVHSHIEGDEENRTSEAMLYYPSLISSPIPIQSVSELLTRFPFIAEVGPNLLSIKQGQWDIDEWLSVPKGTTLTIPGGTVLRFSSTTGLTARGPVMINGTVDNPVILSGKSEGNGKGTWQGLYISNTEEASVWSHLIIKNTKGISRKGWVLPAGVTFYQADAILKNVFFQGNLCEDAINIVRSKFELDGVSIINALSDGLDSDFSTGSIKNGLFENIGSVGGGDAINLSGSVVEITGTIIKNVQDKAISVGENSTMTGIRLKIEGVGAGIVSKDGSKVIISDSDISGFRIAPMMAYIKKQEYGPATIFAKQIRAENLPRSALVQKGNQILIDDIAVPYVDLNINDLYAAEMKSPLQ